MEFCMISTPSSKSKKGALSHEAKAIDDLKVSCDIRCCMKLICHRPSEKIRSASTEVAIKWVSHDIGTNLNRRTWGGDMIKSHVRQRCTLPDPSMPVPYDTTGIAIYHRDRYNGLPHESGEVVLDLHTRVRRGKDNVVLVPAATGRLDSRQ